MFLTSSLIQSLICLRLLCSSQRAILNKKAAQETLSRNLHSDDIIGKWSIWSKHVECTVVPKHKFPII